MTVKEDHPASPAVLDKPKYGADGVDAAGMIDKLEDLQEVASKHGFNFLVYMLDIARAEAVSIQHQQQQQVD